jgi:hypothetical protein
VIRGRLTYANVVSSICLFLVLGGTSWAVATGSIGSSQIRDNSILSKDIRNGQIGTGDIKNGSLELKDLARGQLQAGPRGAAGPQGPQGPRGPAGATDVVVRSLSSSCPANGCAGFDRKTVNCSAGERAIGGGAALVGTDGIPHPVPSDNLTFSGPADSSTGKLISTGTPTAWQSTLQEGNSPLERVAYYYAICARP